MTSSLSSNATSKGILAGLGAHFLWGVTVLYWPLLADMPATSIVAHRMVWSFVFLACYLVLCKRMDEVIAAITQVKIALPLALASVLLFTNWGVYIYAVNSGHAVEGSMGYFITPFLNILMGRFLLGEKLRRPQVIAIFIAALGVLWGLVLYGRIPFIGLTLAFTFATYGYLQKKVPVDSVPALFIELLFVTPFALIWLFSAHPGTMGGMLGSGTLRPILLVCTIIATAVPLMLFGFAARHLTLASIGILQYVSPSIQFILAVTVLAAPVAAADLVTFPFIWAALGLYTWDAIRMTRKTPSSAPDSM